MSHNTIIGNGTPENGFVFEKHYDSFDWYNSYGYKGATFVLNHTL